MEHAEIFPFTRAISSVGQSYRLITGWSGVRIPDGPLFHDRLYEKTSGHTNNFTEEIQWKLLLEFYSFSFRFFL